MLCTYDFTFSLSFCPSEATSSMRVGLPSAVLANPKHFCRENSRQHSCTFKIIILHYLWHHLKYPMGIDLFKKLRDHLITGFRVQSRAGIYCVLRSL